MDVRMTAEFDRWLRRMKDVAARAIIVARIRRIGLHGKLVGDFKSVGDEVIELRFDAGPGYRVYLTELQGTWLLLLLGGDKGSQKRDIAKAKALASRWRSYHDERAA